MPVIPFKDFVPDAADLGNPGSIMIRNALPAVNSYKPLGQHASASSALDAYPRGAIEASNASETFFQYAGDATKLYKQSGATWADVSKLGGYASGTEERWEFTRWAETIIATNFSDDPQVITMGGSNFADLTTDLKFRHVGVVGAFVVAGYTSDGVDGVVRDRVRWCAVNDPTDWTASSVTLSDFRDLAVGGGIQAVVGGDYGVIVSEKSTFRMQFVGSPTIFQIDETIPGVGSLAPGGVVRMGERVYFPSEHGFVEVAGGAQHRFIGAGRIDAFFRDDFDLDYSYRMSSVADPTSNKIFWLYAGSGSVAGRPNKMLVYDVVLDKWGYFELDLEMIWRSGGAAATLEDLDNYDLGTELVTNGDFSASTGWTEGGNWSIGAGVATHTPGTPSTLSQTVSIVQDISFRVAFDVSGRTAGSVTPALGGTTGTAVTSNASHAESITPGAGVTVDFNATTDFDGEIDNVSVRQNDIDTFSITLDSPEFKGGSPLLSAFDTNFRNGSFTGAPIEATIVTPEFELNPGYVTQLKRFMPLIDGGAHTARVGQRDIQTQSVEWTSALSPNSNGEISPRARSRYHRIEMRLTGEWGDAIGVQVDKMYAPRAGRRG